MNQLNPSITSPRAGARNRNKSPRDTTGRRAEALAREQEDRKAVATVDIHEVQRHARLAGWREGYDAGHLDGVDAGVLAVLNVYRAEGAEGIDKMLAELDADEPREDK
jgi:hypothetical protein